jgi:hypothetical protein
MWKLAIVKRLYQEPLRRSTAGNQQGWLDESIALLAMETSIGTIRFIEGLPSSSGERDIDVVASRGPSTWRRWNVHLLFRTARELLFRSSWINRKQMRTCK